MNDCSLTSMRGTTLTEIAIVMCIMAVLIAMGVPVYQSAIDVAHETTAEEDIKTISNAVDSFFVSNGALPQTLTEVGMNDRLDPWGNPYIYKPAFEQTKTSDDPADPVPVKDPAPAPPEEEARKASTFGSLITIVGDIIVVDIDGDGNPDAKFEATSRAEVEEIYRQLLKVDSDDMPVNTDYDLFSLGEDGETSERLDSAKSKDDIIRGRNGDFIKRAEKY